YRPPQWLKSAISSANLDQPGLLILDDFNRAEKRILQGCMQLLQMNALFSWSLPPRWQIILTANPEGGAYNVTEMDDAMLTRMLHVTMKFDPASWAAWAVRAGIDHRGIDFVLTYPEVVSGIRTTARSLTQFFEQIEPIQDLDSEENCRMVSILGKAALESETVDKFLYFCKHVKNTLIQPLEILEAKDFERDVAVRLKRLISGDGAEKRIDRLKTICTRLQIHVTRPEYQFENQHKENMVSFLLNEEMDSALRFNLQRTLLSSKNAPVAKRLIHDRDVGRAILSSL
ncbi:MAG: ATPase, partial [Myxococcota bacterium]|nr:ATPase [Myxococcota bacterium]